MDIVGFRFHPTDEEIIRLLEQKRLDADFSVHAISDANVYDFEPFELPRLSRIQSDEKWCSFFCAPDYINVDTKRVSRATKTGYWKLTGEGCKIKAKRSKKVIGSKRILVFYERPGGSREIKTNWVMHQFSVEDDPVYKKDFFVYRVKRKRDKKHRVSTNTEGQEKKKRCVSTNVEGQEKKKRHVSTNVESQEKKKRRVLTNVEGQRKKKPRISTRIEGEPSHSIAFDNGNPVEGNASSESQLPINPLVFNPRNYVVENTSPKSQSHVAENTSPKSQSHVAENTSPESQSHVAENISPEFQSNVAEDASQESQVPLSNCLASNPRHQVTESNLQVDPQHLAQSNALNQCNRLDHTSSSAHQSPINSEQGPSHSTVSSNDHDVLNSPFGSKREHNSVNPHQCIQNENPFEEMGDDTLPLDFNSTRSVAGFCSGVISELDSQNFREWVNGVFEYRNQILYF